MYIIEITVIDCWEISRNHVFVTKTEDIAKEYTNRFNKLITENQKRIKNQDDPLHGQYLGSDDIAYTDKVEASYSTIEERNNN